MNTTKQLLCVGGLLWLGAVAQAQDDDPNLINITTLEQLDAMRYDLNGNGLVDPDDYISDPPETGEQAAFETAYVAYVPVFGVPSCVSVRKSSCKGYELMANLDFAGTKWAEDCISDCVTGTQADGTTTGNIGWKPIGDYSSASSTFKAVFEGNDHTISNLYISRAIKYVGLFGTFARSDGEIRNLGIVGGSVTGNDSVGGLVGRSTGKIRGCYSTVNATLTGDGDGHRGAGSLVGFNIAGTISECYATGNAIVEVTGGFGTAGGLVGFILGGIISASYATGNATTLNGAAGGLVGYSTIVHYIKACYATGNATTLDGQAGGLVGYSSSSTDIIACYATGNAEATGNNGIAGGLVGENYNAATIIACYATGNATATSAAVGGLVGVHDDANRIEGSYFDSDVSNRPETDPYAKTTSELQSPIAALQSPMAYSGIYEAWDVVHTWNGGEFYLWALCGGSEYPILYVDFDGNDTPTLTEFGSQSSCAQAPSVYSPPPSSTPPTPTDPDLSTIEGRVTALGTQITDLETSQGTQDAKIVDLETNQGTQDAKIVDLETSQGTQDTKITDLEACKSDLEARNTDQSDSLLRHDTEIEALKAKIAAYEAATGGQSTAIYNVPGVSASARVYPNPAKHSLLFANLTPGRVYLYKIYTPSGILLRSDAVQSDEAIDISTLEAGQHLLVLQDDDSREVLRSSLLIE